MKNIKLLLYCCKDKRGYLHFDTREEITRKYYLSPDSSPFGTYEPGNYLNGKILAECDFEVEEIKSCRRKERDEFGILHNESWLEYRGLNIGNYQCDLPQKSCLTVNEIMDYLYNGGYAIHIKNLKERVMELSDVYKYDNSYNNMFGWLKEENEKYIPLDKAPQNMCRVWVYENGEWVMYILISVRPKWMCLILNKDKDVEARKKVLKEMI